MLSKSLGAELNAIINQVLMKKDEVISLINKVMDESKASIEYINSTINKINNTINQLDMILNQIETELFNLEVRADKFNSLDLFYNEVLPGIKEKYIAILEEYFKLLFRFEEIIENKLLEKIDDLNDNNQLVREVDYNVYNYTSMSTRDDREYNKNFLHNESLGFEWHSGKFEDDYMAKENRGSLSIFHIKESKNNRFIDFISGNSNTIYENIMFHPDYGMMHYISAGAQSNSTSFINPEAPVTDFHHLVKMNDEFLGEFTEAKNNPFLTYGDFISNSGLDLSINPFRFYMSLSHIASDSIDKIKYLKDGTYDVKYFIHKIRALEPRDLETPNYFFIGQNKEEDDSFVSDYITKDTNNTKKYLTPFREKTKGLDFSSVYNSVLNIEKNDKSEILNKESYLISKPDIYSGIKISQMFLNYRSNRFTKLFHHAFKNPADNSIILAKYVYDTPENDYGSNITIPFTIKNKSKINRHYDLFDNLVFRIMPGHVQSQNKNLVPATGWISMHCISPIKVGILNSSSMYEIIQHPFTGRFAGSFIQNNLKNNLITTNPRIDTHFYGHSFLTKYEQGLYSRNLTEIMLNKELNFNYNYYEYFNIENDAMGYNKVWFTSLIDNKYYNSTEFLFTTMVNKSREVNNLFSVLTGSSNELNNSTELGEDFVNELKYGIKEELKDFSNSVPLGNIISIPFTIDNPKFLHHEGSLYAKAGSVLDKTEFQEFYRLVKDKYITDHSVEEEVDYKKQFILPDFSDKYFVSTTNEKEVLERIKQAIPNMKLEFVFDADIGEKNALYNGLISENKGTESIVILDGGQGLGMAKETLRISHNSQSSKTKGHDLRVDMYIKVKNVITRSFD